MCSSDAVCGTAQAQRAGALVFAVQFGFYHTLDATVRKIVSKCQNEHRGEQVGSCMVH